jgi:serine/threonine-protein kinase
VAEDPAARATPPGPVPRASAPPRRSGATRPGDGSLSGKDPLLGKKLQEYVLESRLGVGGMGVVYKAVQPMIGKHVAIKVLRPDVVPDPRDLDRLLEEARVVAAIKHRGIINIFGAGTLEDGRQYLIMELLEGESLEQLMAREGQVAAGDAVAILEQTLSALAAAHAAGIVHRDLKPANVFLVKEGPQVYVKLLDFGLARRTSQNVTRIAGTPDYISPEHARGRPAGPPADLYAFGVLCFHVLTGQLPFTGNSPMEVMEKHVHQPPPIPKDINPAIPRAMSELILKLLTKDPGERPDAVQVRADLRAATKQLRAAMTMMSMDAIPQVAEAPEVEARREAHLNRQANVAHLKREVTRRWPFVVGGLVVVWLLGVTVYVLWPTPVATRATIARKSDAPRRDARPPQPDPVESAKAPPVATSALPQAEPEVHQRDPDVAQPAPREPSQDEPLAALPAAPEVADAGVELEAADYRVRLDDFAIGQYKRDHKVDESLAYLNATFRHTETPAHAKRALKGPLEHAEEVCAAANTLSTLNNCHDAVGEAERALQKAFEL